MLQILEVSCISGTLCVERVKKFVCFGGVKWESEEIWLLISRNRFISGHRGGPALT